MMHASLYNLLDVPHLFFIISHKGEQTLLNYFDNLLNLILIARASWIANGTCYILDHS